MQKTKGWDDGRIELAHDHRPTTRLKDDLVTRAKADALLLEGQARLLGQDSGNTVNYDHPYLPNVKSRR